MQKLKRKPIVERLLVIVQNLPSIVDKLKQVTRSLTPFQLKIACVAICLIGLLMLFGCSAPQRRTLPPEAAQRPEPPLYGRSGVDALKGINLYREWGSACEADKAVIRAMFAPGEAR